jgi:mRNA interferase MazF
VAGVIRQGDVWWADLPIPSGSEPGFRRPVLIVQCDAFNDSGTGTIVVIPLTSNVASAGRPGTCLLPAAATGLSKDSVARADHIYAASRSTLLARSGRVSAPALELVLAALDLVIGR